MDTGSRVYCGRFIVRQSVRGGMCRDVEMAALGARWGRGWLFVLMVMRSRWGAEIGGGQPWAAKWGADQRAARRRGDRPQQPPGERWTARKWPKALEGRSFGRDKSVCAGCLQACLRAFSTERHHQRTSLGTHSVEHPRLSRVCISCILSRFQ